MKHPYSRAITLLAMVVMLLASTLSITAQERRPVDSRHPMWLIHVDVWNKADPQKIIDLIPEEVKPFVVLNLSLSCQYDTEKNVYKMPQNAVRTYKSWGTVCQKNGMWFTCQPASGGHTHIQDTDLETFEYFYRRFPNFLFRMKDPWREQSILQIPMTSRRTSMISGTLNHSSPVISIVAMSVAPHPVPIAPNAP